MVISAALGCVTSTRLCLSLTSHPASLAHKHDWYNRFKIAIGSGDSLKGDYSEQLARSKFCLVAPGAYNSRCSTRTPPAISLQTCKP